MKVLNQEQEVAANIILNGQRHHLSLVKQYEQWYGFQNNIDLMAEMR